MKNKKVTIEETKRMCEDFGCTLLSEKYVPKEKLRLIGTCGHEYQVMYCDLKRGQIRCKECSQLKRAENVRKAIMPTFEEVKKYIEDEGCFLISEEYVGNQEPIDVIGICGHKFTTNYHQFKGTKRRYCKKCSLKNRIEKRKLNYEDVKSEIELKGCQLISEIYESTHIKLEILFACGHKGWRNLADFRQSNPICGDCAPHVKRNLEKIKQEYLNYGLELLAEEWTGTKQPNVIKDKDGYKYFLSYDAFKVAIKRNGEFERFGITNPFSIDNIKLWIEKEGKEFEYVSGSFSGCECKNLTFKCFKCKSEWTTSWCLILAGTEKWCPDCNKLTIPDKLSMARITDTYNLKVIRPDLMDEWNYSKNNKLPEQYVPNSNARVEWICRVCGHQFPAKIQDRVNKNSDCPVCSAKRKDSKIAVFLKIYCEDKYDAIKEYNIVKNSETDRFMPYDIYIPKFNLYIEVMGEQHYRFLGKYHRTQEGFKKSQNRDRQKAEFAKNKGNFLEIDLRKVKKIPDAVDMVENYIQEICLQN